MFKVGEFVIKPNTGICRVEDIVYMSLVGNEKKQYYVLLPIEDERAKFYVSLDADRKRLRAVMTSEESRKLIKKIADIEAVLVPDDKLREQQYKEALKSNEPEALVAVIKNLRKRNRTRTAQGKKITSTDEKYFKQAEKALYSELAFSLCINADEIESLITETLEE